MISRRWGAMGALACGVLVAGCGNSDNGPTLGVDGGSGGVSGGQGGGAGSSAAGSGTGGTSSTTGEAGIEMRIATPAVSSGGLNQLLAFAGGAILTMLADTMIPEAYEHGGKLTGVVTTLGFVVAFAIHQAS